MLACIHKCSYLSSIVRERQGRLMLDSGMENGAKSLLANASYARYTAAKRALLANTSLQDDVKTHMLSSLVAGTVATTICAPADVLKSRVQAASKSGAGSSVSLPPPSSFLPPPFVLPPRRSRREPDQVWN